MATTDFLAELRLFADSSRSFTLIDAVDCLPHLTEERLIWRALRASDQVVCVSRSSTGNEYFMWVETAFSVLLRLNSRLARGNRFSMSTTAFGALFNSIANQPGDFVPAHDLFRFGRRLGLICNHFRNSDVCFPLAQVMSFFLASV